MTRRFFVPAPLRAGEFDLPEDEARHFVGVLRARTGDALELTDGAGAEADAEAVAVGRSSARVRVVGDVRRLPPPRPLELRCALPRAGAADDVVRVATEIGATVVRPLLCARGVWRPDEDRDERRAARFHKAAVAALKQCKGVWLPELPPAVPVDRAVDEAGAALLFGALAADAVDFATAVPRLAAASRVCVCVGPEGGFTAEEEAALRARGGLPVRVGRHVLRVETAVVALLALAAAAQGAAPPR